MRASEAVREDSAVAGGRQTFFSYCSCWRADVPGRPARKNHKSSQIHHKKKCDFHSSFSSEKLRGPPDKKMTFIHHDLVFVRCLLIIIVRSGERETAFSFDVY